MGAAIAHLGGPVPELAVLVGAALAHAAHAERGRRGREGVVARCAAAGKGDEELRVVALDAGGVEATRGAELVVDITAGSCQASLGGERARVREEGVRGGGEVG